MWTRYSLLAPAAFAALLGACSSSPVEPSITPGSHPSLVVSPFLSRVSAGASVQLRAALQGASNLAMAPAEIVWTSSDPQVATVAAGLVRTGREGHAEITAAWNGMRGTAQMQVTAREAGSPCPDLAVGAFGASADQARPCPEPRGDEDI